MVLKKKKNETHFSKEKKNFFFSNLSLINLQFLIIQSISTKKTNMICLKRFEKKKKRKRRIFVFSL